VYQNVLTEVVSCNVICVGLSMVTLLTESGMLAPPGAYAAQLAFSACSMFRKNMMSWVVTVSPLDHL
jgi:hypothetical protein